MLNMLNHKPSTTGSNLGALTMWCCLIVALLLSSLQTKGPSASQPALKCAINQPLMAVGFICLLATNHKRPEMWLLVTMFDRILHNLYHSIMTLYSANSSQMYVKITGSFYQRSGTTPFCCFFLSSLWCMRFAHPNSLDYLKYPSTYNMVPLLPYYC